MIESSRSATAPAAGDSPALDALVIALLNIYGKSVRGILMYGSCLRSGDYYNGLVDLYLVVDDYKRCYGSRRLAFANRFLAPNVFYTEAECGGDRVRSKYAVVSLRDLERATSRHCFESYFWGRFAQPVAVLYSRDPGDRTSLENILERARRTFLDRVLPVLPARATVDELWRAGLALSYGTELRTERSDRPRELVSGDREYFDNAALRWASTCPGIVRVYAEDKKLHYQSSIGPGRRRAAAAAWMLRKGWGKSLSVCRLIKALFTFEGGLDYIAWKLERHSGQRVEIPDKVRRRPLIHIWSLFWHLYRRGVFK